uniref:Uncharacterized protein n=1 Tax=Panagrolaimus sp. ES5 TaxID=591445 RepID=A0AC34GJC8_9BILA
MPEKLYYAPPIQIALFDQRTFGMQPQVGVCTISNFIKYLKIPQPPPPINPSDWIEYDGIAETEREEERLELAKFEREKLGNSDEFFAFPDDPNSPRIDWWCRYYFSIDEKEKAPGYAELGFNKMKVFKKPLEDVGDYNGFGDFLDTFYLQRNSRKKKRNNKNNNANRARDICGEMKGKLFIMRHTEQNKKLLLD